LNLASKLKTKLDNCVLLDGDILRETIFKDYPHGECKREEKLDIIIKMCLEYLHEGRHVIATFVSPKFSERKKVWEAVEGKQRTFMEVHVQASFQTCSERDVKGLYSRAKQGDDIKLAGLTEPYEESDQVEVRCDTEQLSVKDCVNMILEAIP